MWQVTVKSTTTEEGRKMTVYGVSAGSTVINDISVDKREIEEFVQRLNRLGASEIHAYELVEDFLGR